MTKLNRTFEELEKTPEFQEELLLLKAQTLIYQLMEHQGIDQATLAKKLGQSEAHVSALLSGTRNMTLKTLARICYLLNSQLTLLAEPLENTEKSIYVPMAGDNQSVVLPHIKPYRFSADPMTLEKITTHKSTRYSVRRFA